MHIDSSFVEPNAWIMDTKNCWRHNLHLTIDGQSQWCSLIPAAQPWDNCLQQSQVVSLQPPLPLPMLKVRATMLTYFMNEDHTSLMIFCRFIVLDESNYLHVVFMAMMETYVTPVKIVHFAKWLLMLQMSWTTS
jgi:hypothetical protein